VKRRIIAAIAAVVVVVAGALGLVGATPASAAYAANGEPVWIPRNAVNSADLLRADNRALAKVGNVVYVGGDFTELAPELGAPAVQQANLAALWRYVPEEYPADVVLFRALDDPDADFSDPTMGWRATVQGEIEVIDAPGTHNSLVHDPVFGELFRVRLRQAQQDAAALVAEPSLVAATR